ncbi:MAG TPA: antibiotic biosynthesis monooxygenase [Acinetobacter ursingii]|uniref:Antibiotic biosynthesis monooxygenase n=1 Tax=Acinetobacter ursingii TaxID=108980 RepID=A0A3D2SJF5_9GAMM|nr:putative quinol monooxygenase [Acinetobacter ursingii]MCH2005981.1 antibiotic biosynthesis monooxygenase [Acinetobacter ursingii]MCU4609415.1 antibiotic biosynthesis monooxygenase [Acinetobacter ursingii]HCK28844.1 antibiotic biosynthesis monooxygenase [Acinetobacter ursingii]HCO09295.1 antibiotic biosynthesis monooxygenase [Acinetobacter ursingii]
MLTIIAEIRTHAATEHRQAVLNAFQKITSTVLAEDGCYGYETLIDHLPTLEMQTQDPNLIVMLEKWQSTAHLETHMQTAHMQRHFEAIKDHVVDVKVRILQSGV